MARWRGQHLGPHGHKLGQESVEQIEELLNRQVARLSSVVPVTPEQAAAAAREEEVLAFMRDMWPKLVDHGARFNALAITNAATYNDWLAFSYHLQLVLERTRELTPHPPGGPSRDAGVVEPPRQGHRQPLVLPPAAPAPSASDDGEADPRGGAGELGG